MPISVQARNTRMAISPLEELPSLPPSSWSLSSSKLQLKNLTCLPPELSWLGEPVNYKTFWSNLIDLSTIVIQSRYWSWSWVKIVKYIFGQYFEAENYQTEVWSRLWNWILVKILRLKLDRKFWSWILVESSKLKIWQDFEADFRLSFWA